jgi:hypothetical protein
MGSTCKRSPLLLLNFTKNFTASLEAKAYFNLINLINLQIFKIFGDVIHTIFKIFGDVVRKIDK